MTGRLAEVHDYQAQVQLRQRLIAKQQQFGQLAQQMHYRNAKRTDVD